MSSLINIISEIASVKDSNLFADAKNIVAIMRFDAVICVLNEPFRLIRRHAKYLVASCSGCASMMHPGCNRGCCADGRKRMTFLAAAVVATNCTLEYSWPVSICIPPSTQGLRADPFSTDGKGRANPFASSMPLASSLPLFLSLSREIVSSKTLVSGWNARERDFLSRETKRGFLASSCT